MKKEEWKWEQIQIEYCDKCIYDTDTIFPLFECLICKKVKPESDIDNFIPKNKEEEQF
jgi:hypothetical protein